MFHHLTQTPPEQQLLILSLQTDLKILYRRIENFILNNQGDCGAEQKDNFQGHPVERPVADGGYLNAEVNPVKRLGLETVRSHRQFRLENA